MSPSRTLDSYYSDRSLRLRTLSADICGGRECSGFGATFYYLSLQTSLALDWKWMESGSSTSGRKLFTSSARYYFRASDYMATVSIAFSQWYWHYCLGTDSGVIGYFASTYGLAHLQTLRR